MITSKGKLVLIYFTNLHRIMGQRRFRMTSFYLVDLEQEKNTKEGGRRVEGALLASVEYLGPGSESLEPHLRQPAYLGQINCFRNPELTEPGPRPR